MDDKLFSATKRAVQRQYIYFFRYDIMLRLQTMNSRIEMKGSILIVMCFDNPYLENVWVSEMRKYRVM